MRSFTDLQSFPLLCVETFLWPKFHVNQRLLQLTSLLLKWLLVSASLWMGSLEIAHGCGAEQWGVAERYPAPPASLTRHGWASSSCCRAGSLASGPALQLMRTPAPLRTSWQEMLGTLNPALGSEKGPKDVLKKAIQVKWGGVSGGNCIHQKKILLRSSVTLITQVCPSPVYLCA